MRFARLLGAAGLLLASAGAAAAMPAVVTTDLNVRSGQGTEYPVVAVMPEGQAVNITGCSDGWCYVPRYGGYASARYLQTVGSAYAYVPGYRYVAPREYRYEAPRYRYWEPWQYGWYW